MKEEVDPQAASAALPAQPPPPQPEAPPTPDRWAKARAARAANRAAKPPAAHARAKNRYKTAAPDPARAGVGSTESTQKGAEPTRYAADFMGDITRMSLEDRQVTTFDLPVHRKKPGWDYKWEPLTVMGQRVDRSVIRDSFKAGWRPEKAGDWPELMVGAFEKFAPEDPVEEGGQMLMGRPLHLSHEAQVETYNKAKMQERDRMQSAATGQSMQGHEGLANVRGIEVRNPSLDVQLAIGSGPRGR